MSITATVRGRLKGEPASSQKIHDEYTAKIKESIRQAGDLSHIVYVNPGDLRQFLAVDTWESAEHAAAFYGSPQLQDVFGRIFEDKPEVIVWEDPGWNKW